MYKAPHGDNAVDAQRPGDTAGGARLEELHCQRGARGLAPENTLSAFARGLALKVDTLETDLAITSDGVVVLSHDPALNPDLARLDGKWIALPGPPIQIGRAHV